MKDIYTISEFANLLGVTIQTLRNWDKSGKLKPEHYTKGGNRLYSYRQLLEFKGQGEQNNKAAVYILNNKENQEALHRIERMLEFSRMEYDIYEDEIKLGQSFKDLIKQVGVGTYSKIVINEHNIDMTLEELRIMQEILSALQVVLVLI